MKTTNTITNKLTAIGEKEIYERRYSAILAILEHSNTSSSFWKNCNCPVIFFRVCWDIGVSEYFLLRVVIEFFQEYHNRWITVAFNNAHEIVETARDRSINDAAIIFSNEDRGNLYDVISDVNCYVDEIYQEEHKSIVFECLNIVYDFLYAKQNVDVPCTLGFVERIVTVLDSICVLNDNRDVCLDFFRKRITSDIIENALEA